jgi:hypothetical protein
MTGFVVTVARTGAFHVAACTCGWESRYRDRDYAHRMGDVHEADHRRGFL